MTAKKYGDLANTNQYKENKYENKQKHCFRLVFACLCQCIFDSIQSLMLGTISFSLVLIFYNELLDQAATYNSSFCHLKHHSNCRALETQAKLCL